MNFIPTQEDKEYFKKNLEYNIFNIPSSSNNISSLERNYILFIYIKVLLEEYKKYSTEAETKRVPFNTILGTTEERIIIKIGKNLSLLSSNLNDKCYFPIFSYCYIEKIKKIDCKRLSYLWQGEVDHWYL